MKWQRNKRQMKEQEKNPEQLSEVEISNIHGKKKKKKKNFRVMMISKSKISKIKRKRSMNYKKHLTKK